MAATAKPAEAAAPARRDGSQRLVAVKGRIWFWPGGSLWIGQGRGRAEWHEHHAHQIALARDGDFRFRGEPQGRWTTYEAALVPSHRAHGFECDEATMAHLFVEPESTAGRALVQRFGRDAIAELPHDAAREATRMLFAAFDAETPHERMIAVARDAVTRLAGTDADVPAVDPRVQRTIEAIRRRLDGPWSLADAAAVAALSPSRLRHLFVQETGTSFRAYVLWLRLNVAIEAAMAGASWTEAAHAAGFADSAHLSRTHRRMLGIEPTAIRLAAATS